MSGCFLRTLVLRYFVLFPDKYSSQFGGGSQYAYFHEEDETSFQLVDTARTQKTAYQRNRMRFAQVTCSWRQDPRGASAAQDSFPVKMSVFLSIIPAEEPSERQGPSEHAAVQHADTAKECQAEGEVRLQRQAY